MEVAGLPRPTEGDVERHRPTLEQDGERAPFLHIPGEPVEVTMSSLLSG